MCILKGEENPNYFYELHFVLKNTSESINEKDAGKAGAEFPPDPLSAPAAFWIRSLEENRRDNLSGFLSYYGCWTESLGQDLKIWLRIFLKESSNFVQKTQPTFTFCKIISFCPGVLCLLMVFFRYDPGIFKVTGQGAVGNAEVPALKRRENKVFKNQSFYFRLLRKF